MTAVCDLADDFRDAILDYLVSNGVTARALGSLLMQLTVLTAEGNLHPKLYINRKSQDPYS